MDHEPTNVLAAFEMLLEEVETEIEYVNNVGGKAFISGDYTRVDEMRALAQKLTSFRERAADLRRDWQTLAAEFEPVVDEDTSVHAKRRNLGQLKRGTRTSEDAYRLPILQALVELDGSGQTAEVMALVKQKMASQLKDVDFEPLPSNPNIERWYNTGQWARNAMVKEGLMKDDSPRGVWEISEEGHRLIARS